MICGKCGAENGDFGKFCRECGQPLEKTDKKNNLKKKWVVLGAGAGIVVFIAIICLVISFLSPEINLNKYISFECNGYDGYGRVVPVIDWDEIEDDYGDRLSLTQDAIEELDGFSEYVTAIDILRYTIKVDVSKTENLSNGEKIEYSWHIDEELFDYVNCRLQNTDGTYSVSGLDEVEKFDPFENLEVVFSGTSPRGKIGFKYTGEILNTYNFVSDKTSNLSNGQTITISINDVDVEGMLQRYGRVPQSLEKQYVVEGLEEYVESYSEIPSEYIATLKEEVEDVIFAYIANSYNTTSTLSNLKYEGYVFNCAKDVESKNINYNELYLIYSGIASSSIGKFQTTVVYFPVKFSNFVKNNSEISYKNYDGIVGKAYFANSTYQTKGYLNPYTCYQSLVTTNASIYDIKTGDGFEKFEKYELIYKLDDINEEYKASLRLDAENRVKQYISSFDSKYYKIENLAFCGEYLLTLKTQGTDFGSNNAYIIVFSAVVTSLSDKFVTTTVFYPVEYDGLVELPDGEYICTEEEDIVGKSYFLSKNGYNSWYSTKGYISGTEMFSKIITANRVQYEYEVSEGLKEFGE